MNFFSGRFGQEIYDVTARSAQSYYCEFLDRELRRDHINLSPRRGGVEIVERRVVFLRLNYAICLRCRRRVEIGCVTRKYCSVRLNLLVIVLVVPTWRFTRKRELGAQRLAEPCYFWRRSYGLENVAFACARTFTSKLNRVILRSICNLSVQIETRYQHAVVFHLAFLVYIRNVSGDEIRPININVVAVVAQTTKVVITTY